MLLLILATGSAFVSPRLRRAAPAMKPLKAADFDLKIYLEEKRVAVEKVGPCRQTHDPTNATSSRVTWLEPLLLQATPRSLLVTKL